MQAQESRKVATSLERLAAQGANTTRIVDAVVSTWQAVDAVLAPVLGDKGVAALYCRSLYLVRESHPWLAAVNEGTGSQMDLGLLGAALAMQDNFGAASAAGDQFALLHELLRSLIGPSLTEQLLRNAWDNPFGGESAQDLSQ